MNDDMQKRVALNIIKMKKKYDSLPKVESYKLASNIDLKQLTLDDLAFQYGEIDRQSHLLKGQILLEVRRRFSSDKEFGQWTSAHKLNVGSQQNRNQLMHLAEFFVDGRDMTGIGITAAYAISAPKNRAKALAVYKQAYGKNLSVKEVKTLLAEGKEKQDSLKEKTKKTPNADYDSDVKKPATNLINNILKGKADKFKLATLKLYNFLRRIISNYIENITL